MVDVAAKRAEAGDMSAYNTMVQNAYSRQLGNDGMLKSSRNGIENELKNAEKLTWGLNSKNEEQQNIARNEINVALRSAEEWAEKTGQDLPTSYYRLKDALKESYGGQNANELVNYYRYKQEKGELTEADRKYVEEVLRPKMNSEDFNNLFGFLKESKGMTKEAKAKAKAKNEKWESWFNRVVNAANIAEEIAKLSREEYEEFKKRFTYDPKTGELKRI